MDFSLLVTFRGSRLLVIIEFCNDSDTIMPWMRPPDHERIVFQQVMSDWRKVDAA